MLNSIKNLSRCLAFAVALLILTGASADAAITPVDQFTIAEMVAWKDSCAGSSAIEVFVLGDYAYVCVIEGLATFDISDPTNISMIAWQDAPSPNWSTIDYQGDGFLYLSCTTGGFHTISLANPRAPRYLVTYNPAGGTGARNVTVCGNYAYVAYTNQGLYVISMDASRTTLATHYALGAQGVTPLGLDNDGTYVYIAVGNDGLIIRSIANLLASSPTVTGSIDFGAQVAGSVKVWGNWAFVCCGADGIYVVDVTNKAAPVLHATNNTAGSADYCDVVGNFLYVADNDGGLKIFDISVLPIAGGGVQNLNLTDSYDPGNPAETYRGVYATNGYVYVADRAQGLRILNAATRKMNMQRSFPRLQFALMGIPNTVTTGVPTALFGDNFANAAVGSPRWRVSRWNDAEQSYIRYEEADRPVVGNDDNPPAFAPGIGYWVIQDVVSNCVLDVTVAQNNGIVNQGAKHSVALEPGRSPKSLSQVANPYHYPYDLSTTYFNISGVGAEVLWSAAGAYLNQNAYTWNGTQYVTIPWNQFIKPWVGFWVIQTDHTKTISILFTPRNGFAGAPPQPKDRPPLKLADNESWTLDLPIVSTDGLYQDEYNRIGIGENNTDLYDPYDAFELAPLGSQFVQLYFPHDDWEIQPADYTFDLRSVDFGESNTKSWDLIAQAWQLPNTEFAIRWPNIDQIPEKYSLALVNPESGNILADLRQSDRYTFRVGDQDVETVSFRVVATLNENIVSGETLPSGFRLESVYPNPFNSSVKISYSLAIDNHVRISIHDLSGREVECLYDQSQQSGGYSLTWAAQDFPSGMYLCRIQAGDDVRTNKLTLMK